MNKIIWKDIWQSIKHTKGQFFSILGLMLLGAYCLVGLVVTGPDMRDTGNDYAKKLNTPDLTVISNYGLDHQDVKRINKTKGLKQAEYGYMTDTVVKGSKKSFRIFSKPSRVGKYELRNGHLPNKKGQIALAAQYHKKYKIGDKINFTEKSNVLGKTFLKRHSFKIVGFVRSSQILSNVNLGQSTSGTGELKGYAVAVPQDFNSDVYMTANLTYKNLRGIDSYGPTYTNRVTKDKKELKKNLNSEVSARKSRINDYINSKLQPKQDKLDQAKDELQTSQDKLISAQKQLTKGKAAIAKNEQVLQSKSRSAQSQLQAGASQLAQAKQAIGQMQAAGKQNTPQYQAAVAQYSAKANELQSKKQQLQATSAGAQAKLSQAKQELASKQAEYKQAKQKFAQSAPAARRKISAGQKKLDKIKEQVKELKSPTYTISNRREVPGSEGDVVYTTISQVVDDLAKVFPIFLYFVAALVTFTTMNRFIDEERINSGTLKALGYDDHVIINKFTFYGFISGTLGTIIGIYLGHTLLPQIVYHAYYNDLTLPPIEQHFYWGISIIAIILSWISSVLPAYLTAKGELNEKPAALLLPKPPAAGSKIMLEKIPFIWNHLNFTHKVTARNVFRYKKRMLMTIFGVCGAAALLFTGFSVKNSIGNMNKRQFGDLIHYDMIVAKKDPITHSQNVAVNKKLHSNAIKSEAPIHYESMSKTAGKNNDSQDIKLIVPSNTKNFKNYVHLNNRKTHKNIPLSNNGAVVSERLANLLHAKVGDKISMNDGNGHKRTIKISGITEMYMGHFVFMNPTEYQKVFNKTFSTNASMVILKNGSSKNTENEAYKFMKLGGTAGVVQNTTITQEVNTVVESLNMIMIVLIIVAGLLAIVIQYNLTNINVSEQIRELSTIKVLGFYDNEVTMYIYRETILLTCIGLIVGYGVGDLLYRYILYVVPPDNVMFNPALSASSFLWPFGVIGIITLVLGFVVNNKLKNIDMLEALKSVD